MDRFDFESASDFGWDSTPDLDTHFNDTSANSAAPLEAMPSTFDLPFDDTPATFDTSFDGDLNFVISAVDNMPDLDVQSDNSPEIPLDNIPELVSTVHIDFGDRPSRVHVLVQGDNTVANPPEGINTPEAINTGAANFTTRFAFMPLFSEGPDYPVPAEVNGRRLQIINDLLEDVPLASVPEGGEFCPICRESYKDVKETVVVEDAAVGGDLVEGAHAATGVEDTVPGEEPVGGVATGTDVEDHSIGEEPVKLKVCGHVFGRECITTWLSTRSICCTCRHNYSAQLTDGGFTGYIWF